MTASDVGVLEISKRGTNRRAQAKEGGEALNEALNDALSMGRNVIGRVE